MRRRSSGVFCAICLAALAVSGCTRSLRPADDAEPADGPAPEVDLSATPAADATIAAGAEVESIDSAAITIDAPAVGAGVASPAVIAGRIDLEAGRLPVAQVLSWGPQGELIRRGNGPIAVDDDGAFEVSIDYVLEEAGPGAVEVVIVDPVSGTVTDRERMVVELQAAP
jgi:hypothetical protein